jgi:hypothetical protein
VSSPLESYYGSVLLVRPPVPATVNKAGANFKSEVAHELYSPREAYDEWLSICEAILKAGGDAIFDYEEQDEPFLDRGNLEVTGDGEIRPEGSSEVLGHMDDILTGRVFTANGPWLTVVGKTLHGVMPNMLAHRQSETGYFRALLWAVAEQSGLQLDLVDNPYRWEGLADVAVVGDRAILTYTVSGHYDEGIDTKTMRSTRKGHEFVADKLGVPEDSRVFVELVYPHFHGDTVHFGARPPDREPVLFHYEGGLYGDGASWVAAELGADRIVAISGEDAVDAYAGNSRQVNGSVLVPEEISDELITGFRQLGLKTFRIPLSELFGKAGGGPACATLYLPSNLPIPQRAPIRYSVRRDDAYDRRERLPEQLKVDPAFFQSKVRG